MQLLAEVGFLKLISKEVCDQFMRPGQAVRAGIRPATGHHLPGLPCHCLFWILEGHGVIFHSHLLLTYLLCNGVDGY